MYEQTYKVVGARLESKDIVVLELLDEESSPNALKSDVLRIAPSDYATGLSNVPVGSKVRVSIAVIPLPAAPSG